MAKTAPAGSSCIPEGFIYLLTRHPENTGSVYNGIKFINQSDNNGSCWEFFLDTTDPAHPFLARKIGTDPAVALTSTNFQFDSTNPVRFAISKKDGSIGNGSVDGQGCTGIDANLCGAVANTFGTEYPQPRVTIVFNVKIPGDDQPRIIQTTVSRRNLNVAR